MSTNIISNYNHAIVTRQPTNNQDTPLTNSDLSSNYCSHNYFVESTLPNGADVILRTDDADMFPTLVEYKLGNGKVIASGLTWEHAYNYGSQFAKALPDLFKYAFDSGGEHKASGINVYIYPEDNWGQKRPETYKSQGDLIDIVACITNNVQPESAATGVNLTFEIDDSMVESNFYVYKRKSAEDIDMVELNAGEYSNTEINGVRTITVNNLTIPIQSQQTFNDFVFRFKLKSPLAKGSKIDASKPVKATVSGNNIDTDSALLSEGGSSVSIIEKGKIILTNRELLYKNFSNNTSQVNDLWETVYKVAADAKAVVYHVDKYDRCDDDGTTITIDWFEDRQHLANGDTQGKYNYGPTWNSNDDPNNNPNDDKEEETRINQAASKVKGILKEIIDRSGKDADAEGSGRYVAVLGGDAVIPFYRVFDPSKSSRYNGEPTIYHTAQKGHYDIATSVIKTDSENNYLLSDIFYRDYDGQDWEDGKVENIFVGRVTGASPENIQTFMSSSNHTTSQITSENNNIVKFNVVKLENNMRDGQLGEYVKHCIKADYNIITNIDKVNIDVPNPDVPPTEGMNDPTEWVNFKNFFEGNANDSVNFNIMRLMCHGSIDGISSSEGTSHSYFTANDIKNNNQIRNYFSQFYPFFVFDACLVGVVDGYSTSLNLFNALSSLNVRGLIGASGVTWTPRISTFLNHFTEPFVQNNSAGKSLSDANRNYKDTDGESISSYTRFQVNLFGLPWASIQRIQNIVTPFIKKSKETDILKTHIMPRSYVTNTKTFSVDASNYTTESVDSYQKIAIDEFDELNSQSKPIIPVKKLTITLPLNAVIDNVNVIFSNSNNLGIMNIPAYQMPPPMPEDDWEGGYIGCPNDLGIFPAEQYTTDTAELTGYKNLFINIYPVTYNTQSKETILYETANIEVTYTTPNQGTVTQFTSDKNTYSINETIQTNTTIENITGDSVTYNLTVDIQDLAGNVVKTNTVSQSIAGNTEAVVPLSINAPAQSGAYTLIMTTSDSSQNTIGNSRQDIQVIAGRIVNFNAPISISQGKYGEFKIEFENLTDAKLNVFENIYIYNSQNIQVAKLPELVTSVEANTSSVNTTQWFPQSLVFGKYKALLSVKFNDTTITETSEWFDILLLEHPDTSLVLTNNSKPLTITRCSSF